jgi:predicted transcriptional regulator
MQYDSQHRLTGFMLLMLQALDDNGEWLSRRQIAMKIRKGSLLAYHIKLLNALVDCGLVEVEKRETRRGSGYQYYYRAVKRATEHPLEAAREAAEAMAGGR